MGEGKMITVNMRHITCDNIDTAKNSLRLEANNGILEEEKRRGNCMKGVCYVNFCVIAENLHGGINVLTFSCLFWGICFKARFIFHGFCNEISSFEILRRQVLAPNFRMR